ncbi:MAG TPA: flagellar hook-associated protein FlgK [Rhodocyclaceae bacterium]|nr:flagellar hook-associated protein FlgK [Rhodocyclaceae bacterium]
MPGMLGAGLSALNAANAGLITTSHNISNANTAGYSRQTALYASNFPQLSGSGFFGQGVQIQNVRREYDQFLNQNVLSAATRHQYSATYRDAVAPLDNLLSDENAGLSSALAAFFRGVNDVANNPASIPARQAMISLGDSLASRFNAMDTQLRELREQTEGQIASSVALINGYATRIAELNAQLMRSETAGPSIQANDLRDQREQLLYELGELVNVSSQEDAQGMLNVFVGSGQSLVLGTSANAFKVVPDGVDPARGIIALQTRAGDVTLPESLLNGGRLGALLGFRSEVLDRVQNELGGIAKEVSRSFNEQHRLGLDLQGNAGGDFFRDLGAVSARDAMAAFAVALTDPQAIAAADGSGGAGNNENALVLAGLQTEKVFGGTATFQSTYAQLVTFVGNKSREVQVSARAHESQLQQAKSARESLSGVNLDEEAANLIRFQQAYQAAARVMSLSGTLFDEVLSIARR